MSSAACCRRWTGSDRRRCAFRQLVARSESEGRREVILALNATVDGQTTAHYIADQLAPLGMPVTSLAKGVPIGGELDYLDDGTIGAALMARRAI